MLGLRIAVISAVHEYGKQYSEFDALSIVAHGGSTIAQHNIVPVATGSTSGSRLDKWIIRIALASRVLLAFDTDRAGEQAAQWWQQTLGRKASRLKPTQHDVNDMVRAGENIEDWLLSGIALTDQHLLL